MSSDQIAVETLHKLLICDAEAGKLWWRERPEALFTAKRQGVQRACRAWNTRYAGTEALTCLRADGYFSGAVNYVNLLAHRVIWAMSSGSWPVDHIDHINGDRSDNRICNLREATGTQNKGNVGKTRRSTRPFIGVSRAKQRAGWVAEITDHGRYIHVGTFADPESAARARDAAAIELRGDFARLNFPKEQAHG